MVLARMPVTLIKQRFHLTKLKKLAWKDTDMKILAQENKLRVNAYPHIKRQ